MNVKKCQLNLLEGCVTRVEAPALQRLYLYNDLSFSAWKGPARYLISTKPSPFLMSLRQKASQILQRFLPLLQYGGQEVSLDSARELHRRANIEQPLEDVFALTDLDKNGKLNYPEFLLFMYFLKLLRKGVLLPDQLSHNRVRDSFPLEIHTHFFAMHPPSISKQFVVVDLKQSACLLTCCM